MTGRLSVGAALCVKAQPPVAARSARSEGARAFYQAMLATMRASLGSAGFGTACADGAAMSVAQALVLS